MSDRDPSSDVPEDRTIIMPTPGRRRDPGRGEDAPPATPPAASSAASSREDPGAVTSVASTAYHNPLLAAAAPLLAATVRIRETPHHDDPGGLQQSLAQAIRQFETRAQQAGVKPEHVIGARYLLCTLLDEAAADTPWGGSGTWARQSLLVLFHNETWGGEKCFVLLGKLAENPTANRDLLELFHVVLGLGFQGRYRVIDGGAGQLASVRERLWQMLERERGPRDPELSPGWRSDAAGRSLRWRVPIWVVAGVAALLVAALYAALVFMLNAGSDPTFAAIQDLRLKTAPLPPAQALPTPPPAPVVPRLAGFLAPEVRAEKVAVADLPDRSVVTIRGDGLFAAGSADIDEHALPILSRIAEALKATPGSVLVAGHSDSQPIRSMRFPSNWHLSLARAQSVAAFLGQTVPSQRIRAEGKSDTEPVAPNTTADGRSRNRRVEITLFAATPQIDAGAAK